MSSQIYKDRAIILKTYDFGESSKIVVSLTKQNGKLRMLAKGARKMKSSFAGSLLTGNIGDIVFYFKENRVLQTLSEINIINGWSGSNNDWDKICLLQAGLEVVDRCVVEREPDELMFEVVEKYIRSICFSENSWFDFFTLEVKLLILLGHFPSLKVCSHCGKAIEKELKVIPSSGEVFCKKCGSGEAIYLPSGSFSSLKRMIEYEFDSTDSFPFGSGERKSIGKLMHYLYLHHIQGYKLPNALSLLKGASEK